jgi:putative N6-adenine-specific DNA methylase
VKPQTDGSNAPFEIFLVAPPGLEATLADEAREKGFIDPEAVPGGVTITGGWPEVWRANLEIRGASSVLARIASFRAFHLAQLDKRARKVDWAAMLRPDIPIQIEASCRRSKIYHAGAAAQRIERAITETLGAPMAKDARLRLMARIDGAATSRRWAKRRCAKPSPRCFCASVALTERSRWSIRCAVRALS